MLKLYETIEHAASADGLTQHVQLVSSGELYKWTLFGGAGAIAAVTIAWCVLSFG